MSDDREREIDPETGLLIPRDLQDLIEFEQWVAARQQQGRLGSANQKAIVHIFKIYYERLLVGFCHGRGTNRDMQKLIVWHWPHLLRAQQHMPEDKRMPIDWWQCRIIRDVLAGFYTDMQETWIKGCTKAGKGFSVAAAACLWFQPTEESCKIIVSSNTADHAKKVMFSEICALRIKMRFKSPGRESQEQIKTDSPTKYAAIANPENPEAFAGQHSRQTLFLFDEITGCPEEFWDLAKTQSAMQVGLMNPRHATGYCRAAYPQHGADEYQVVELDGGGGRKSLHTIGGSDCINVKRNEVIIEGQIDAARYQRIMSKGGRWARVFGEGRFPLGGDENVIISSDWINRHVMAFDGTSPVEAFGLDVASSISGDRSILTAGGPSGIRIQHELQEINTMSVVGWVLRTAQDVYDIDLTRGMTPVTVDMDGLGRGVGDRLREQGVMVLEFRGNATAEEDPKTYANLRAEAYSLMGLRLNPNGPWGEDTFQLPADYELHQELCAPKKVYGSDGVRYHITPKKKSNPKYKGEFLTNILGRSPDKGDSAVYCFHAIRHFEKYAAWANDMRADFIASGEDPAEERIPIASEELDEIEAIDPAIADVLREQAAWNKERHLHEHDD